MKQFVEVVSADTDVSRLVSTLAEGIQHNEIGMNSYLSKWEKGYRTLWEVDKDNYIRRYAKQQFNLVKFEQDIGKYKEHITYIENEESISNISFARIDCSQLKYALVGHCNQWIAKFTQLLSQMATKELHDLHNVLEEEIQKLRIPPRNLETLKTSLDTLKECQESVAGIEARFEPLEAQFALLKKLEVEADSQETVLRESLPSVWATFRQSISDSDAVIKQKKDRFKADLIKNTKDFATMVTQARQEFLDKGPFTNSIPSDKANKVIKEYKAQCEQLLEKEEKNREGLEMFGMEAPQNKDLAATIKELEVLEKVWEMVDEWNAMWEQWRNIKFTELSIATMQEEAEKFQKKLVKVGRDSKQWQVWSSLKERLDQFRLGLPLIEDLKNSALRKRHWDRMQEEIGKQFDYQSDSFNLDTIFKLGLDQYTELIANISISATKEMAIENGLKDIASKWEELRFEMAPHKECNTYRISGCDDIFQVLEDNKVNLADMKSSRYFFAFEQQVEYWEKTLSRVLEIVELLLTVQRLWLYLESIFVGSDDIRRQLPAESATFDKVNVGWKSLMDVTNKDPVALKTCLSDGIYDNLLDMEQKLEKVQHSLDQYLESKRRSFPRFYFLSDHDLLEVLGQAKDPNAVQRHLHNCFDNINALEFVTQGKSEGRRKVEAVKMISQEGEEVPFLQPVPCDGGVEIWLRNVEEMMVKTLNRELAIAVSGVEKFRKEKNAKNDKYLRTTPGQLVITASQIFWTASCEKGLDAEKGNPREVRKQQASILHKLSEMVRGQLTPITRLKLVSLLTIEIHQRDVTERLVKTGVKAEDFEWKSQLRFYWEKDEDCHVRQTDFDFHYGYEYLGNTGRLVITALTDKVYLALTTALMMKKGGNPQGPAGTGKTETVKDLGKALGKYVVVHNCSDKIDVTSMGKSLSGLCQTGSWACFDEFNRIETNVLSVIAVQIAQILATEEKTKFIFQGAEIMLRPGTGIFVTMNPGYAGRSELPDNLKSQFRPVSMMVPDFAVIGEIILFSEGFTATKTLSRKMVTLYQLCIEQLSRQDHYDFTLRSIKSVLVTAGSIHRADPEMPEDLVLIKALKDMNIAKFVGEDISLFLAILSDLFPGAEVPDQTAGVLQPALEEELKESGLQPIPLHISKALQLYDTKKTRHGTMVVGKSGAGKSVCWKALAGAITRLKKKDPTNPAWNVVRTTVLNPKAITLDEIYGAFNPRTHEWSEGIFSTILRNCSADTKPDEKWIVFDGPVDTLWIESMNSVLDDNKILTPVNGERIYLKQQVSLLFEVEDLKQASPATVSRCGMIYIDVRDVGWRPYVASWINGRAEKESHELLKQLFDKHVQNVIDFRAKECKELIPTTELNAVISLCNIYDSLATAENGVVPTDQDFYPRMVEMWFIFSLIWSVGASIDEDSRKKFDSLIREIDSQFPRKDTVFEYFVDPVKRSWSPWEEKLVSGWRYPPESPFYKIFVPTVDTLRNSYLLNALVKNQKHVLLVGNSGTGKTATIESVLSGPLRDNYNTLSINFSAQTSAAKLQEFIEQYVEKRTQNVFVPRGGKKLIAFIDDLNLPEKDTFGSQPPLELLRQWIDYGFWYDRTAITPNNIKGMQLIAAMGPPGGGRTQISQRLQSRFNLINVTFPDDAQIKRIFGTMIGQKLQDFEEEIKPLGEIMTQATWDVYQSVTNKLLPTPSRIHYVFNLRDMSKVFQGLLQAQRESIDSADTMIKLWVHENLRVFYDRLVDDEDRGWFTNLLSDKLVSLFNVSWAKLFRDSKTMPLFCDFVEPEERIYREYQDNEVVKRSLLGSLEEYNISQNMDLVLFRKAIEHICRIHRVLRQPRGNALLVGLGGSGRQSLTKLAAFVAGCKYFTVDVRKGFREADLREKLKELYNMTSVEEKATVFMFSDTQILRRGFMEDISNMLSSGEIPNMYTPEELTSIRDAMKSSIESQTGKPPRLDPEQLYRLFIERARNNMHLVLVMSPVGKFREYCRMFPAIVNCTTIDWFSEWPSEALKEVAEKYLSPLELGELSQPIATVCEGMHNLAAQLAQRMRVEAKRDTYVTPTNYLEMLRSFGELLKEKRDAIGSQADKLESGLKKMDDAKVQVEVLGEKQKEMQQKLSVMQKECDEALVIIVQQKQEASDQAREIELKEQKLSKEEENIKEEQGKAQVELDKTMPAFETAQKALKALDRRDLGEVRTYITPQPLMEKVMEAVLVLRHATDFSWAEARRQLSENSFIPDLLNYQIETVNDVMLRKIDKYTMDPEFRPEKVQKVSVALMSLCQWVHAVDKCAHAYRDIAPKQAAVAMLKANMEKNAKDLEEARSGLRIINEKLEKLRADHSSKVSERDRLAAEAKETEVKILRASKLINGLASERVRWEASIQLYREQLHQLPGDCLVASAFLSYSGPFSHEYRQELIIENPKSFLKLVAEAGIPCSSDFNVSTFLAEKVQVREWTMKGLPNDSFSIENGALTRRGKRWPLIIDPEGQANMWIKNMERANNLKVINLNQDDYLRTLENAVHFGIPVLLEDVGEELDPSLEPILAKKIIKIGSRMVIKMEEGKEIEYNPDFRFIMTTKLSNPSYPPEITTKTTVVNFTVREQGLQQQLLGTVVRHERKELEEQKDALVVAIAEAQKTLVMLEEKILHLLNTTQGSLLDNENLVDTLESAKTTSAEMKNQLEVSVQNEVKIDSARQGFLPCAIRAAVLFFVLKDMSSVDNMYQFSLDAYTALFKQSLANSPKSDDLQERIQNLNDYHTTHVYRTTCRGLFENHKLLFSFQLCVKIMESEKRINKEEYQFLLRGGQVLSKESQMPNPCPDWLPEFAWDNITVLDKMYSFRNIANSFEQNIRDWRDWYFRPEPENIPLPGEWENKCNELQHLILVRCFRPDRVVSAVNGFISSNLDPKFIDPPSFDPKQTFEDSTTRTPIIFILSPGVDPLETVKQLSIQLGYSDRFHSHALGQGQESKAMHLLEDGMKEGHWVFLANCHLMVDWLPTLEKIYEQMNVNPPHQDFRLWLSSSPHKQFPISILQQGIKITTQPPKGLKQNLTRLYKLMTENMFSLCKTQNKYKKLAFALCFFHSVLLERKKFLSLGYNTPYDFNDSDFLVSEALLVRLLDQYQETPWAALRYLISEINYGGRVTDRWDMLLLSVYIKKFFCNEALQSPQFRLSQLSTYYIPEDGTLQSYRDYIATLPIVDKPEAFGQHGNADIASQIQDANSLLSTLLSLQPRVAVGSGGESREKKVMDVIHDLQKRLPENPIDMSNILRQKADDPTNPLLTVLVHEVERYNELLAIIKRSLIDLEKGITGTIVMSADLDEMLGCLFDNRVPPRWRNVYPSLRLLAPWVFDLVQRLEMFQKWSADKPPKVFWLGGFTFPTGFLTALLQVHARKNNVSIDSLSWEFIVMKEELKEIKEYPSEGAYISGLLLEGASWDFAQGCLKDPNTLELECSMPIMYFKPVETKKKVLRDPATVYNCPAYLYQIREGTRERPSYMLTVELSSGKERPEYWTQRGTAVLLTK
eukprot:TRINITY_DN1618_c0_g1_i1.p1 TRINITY_DN1618_c0_g1~~TRINITY_DN1618_c0_g1_i1.p1  ORF type:complete len:3854 (-),score=1122.51 TRINITY_DN1618_c0_g1_i1:31-10566(-)